MNKSTKIWLNYIAGGIVSALLLWSIYRQVDKQLATAPSGSWKATGSPYYMVIAIALMLLNAFLESYKWHVLLTRAAKGRYLSALSSYLAGIAFSIVTPNRVGEYPGRILYLRGKHTIKYVVVSVSGVIAQLSSLYFFGFIGLVYYNIAFPAPLFKTALLICIILNILIVTVYWRFEEWIPVMKRSKWFRRFAVYGMLMKRMTKNERIKVLLLSLLRVCVFTAQYLFLLRWANVEIPFLQGFCMAALFFWTMAVVPSLALTELGIRGAVSIYFFGQFSTNTIGILTATTGIWLLNLILPSILGSILIIRMKWLR